MTETKLYEINPRLYELVKILRRNGIAINHRNNGGRYGYFEVHIGKYKIGIWIERTTPIRIFFPNWGRILKTEFTNNHILIIESYNLRQPSNIYWLFENEYITFSSNTFIETDLIIQENYKYIFKKLKNLIDSRNIFKRPIFNEIYELDISVFQNKREEISKLGKILFKCNCQDISIDDDGDIQFKYQNKTMIAKFINSKEFKILNKCAEFIFNEEEDTEEFSLTPILLCFQWCNMIFPVQITFYRPTDSKISITTNITISTLFINNYERYIDFFRFQLDTIYNSFKGNTEFTDIILGKDEGVELLNLWYQPIINNWS